MVTAVNGNSKDYNVEDYETDPKTPQDLKNEIKAMLIAICDAVVQSTTSDGQNNANDMKTAEAKDSTNATEAKGSVQPSTSITPDIKKLF